MKLADADALARDLAARMKPNCEQIVVAGSIRRRCAEVGDIELVVVPRWRETRDPSDLFSERTIPQNALHEWATCAACPLTWIKPGVPGVEPWRIRPEGKYWRGFLEEHRLKVDVFLATQENLGVILVIRTGSASFSHELAAYAKRRGTPFRDGRLLDHAGEPLVTPTEESVFAALGLRMPPPEERTGPVEAARPYGRPYGRMG